MERRCQRSKNGKNTKNAGEINGSQEEIRFRNSANSPYVFEKGRKLESRLPVSNCQKPREVFSANGKVTIPCVAPRYPVPAWASFGIRYGIFKKVSPLKFKLLNQESMAKSQMLLCHSDVLIDELILGEIDV